MAGSAELYCPDFGRPSVPPSLLAIALLLQAHNRVSDAEATQRAAFNMRWKVALGVEMDERAFAKSTLQLFRAQLLSHDQAQAIFTRSLEFGRQTEYLEERNARGSGQPDAGGRPGGLRGHVWGLFGQVLAAGGFWSSHCRIRSYRQWKTDNSCNLRSARSIIARTQIR